MGVFGVADHISDIKILKFSTLGCLGLENFKIFTILKNMIYEVFVVADHEYDIHFVIYVFSTKDIANLTTKYQLTIRHFQF